MRTIISIVVLLLFTQIGSAQVRQRKAELNRVIPKQMRLTPAQQQEAGVLFESVGKMLLSDSPARASALFDRSVHLALPGVEQGQFSKDQASQLFSSFLRNRAIITFKVKKREDSLASPYLSALLTLTRDGREEQLSLYLSLVRSDGSWKIGHFSVY